MGYSLIMINKTKLTLSKTEDLEESALNMDAN